MNHTVDEKNVHYESYADRVYLGRLYSLLMFRKTKITNSFVTESFFVHSVTILQQVSIPILDDQNHHFQTKD